MKFLELQTVLLEVEAILNSRPLCPLYEDNLEEPLTPNHLLFGRKFPQRNEFDHQSSNLPHGVKRVRYIERVLEHFWERWRKEYVVELRNYLLYKYKKKNDLIPTVNDIVIVYESKTPRQNWCLGRITELIPSKDKQIRGAKVLLGRTKNIIERPINKLYPLEFANEFSDNAITVNEVEIIRDSDGNSNVSDIDTTKPDLIEITNDVNRPADKRIIETDINSSTRNRQQAAIFADLKLKYM